MAATVTNLIRAHLLESLGCHDPVPRLPDLPELLRTEWCEEFEQLRRNRMIMGAFRYGLLNDPQKWKSADGTSYDLMKGLRNKLDYYQQSGNIEALVDAGNYVMLIYIHPSHPSAHFRAEDDHNHCP